MAEGLVVDMRHAADQEKIVARQKTIKTDYKFTHTHTYTHTHTHKMTRLEVSYLLNLFASRYVSISYNYDR